MSVDSDGELDDQQGDPEEGSGTYSHEDYRTDGGEVEPSETDSDGDLPADEQSTDEDNQPSGPVESGADQGLGGVKIEEPLPEYGTPDDVEAAVEHGHKTPNLQSGDTIEAAQADAAAISVAVIQGLYFETPSVGVKEVQEHRYGPNTRGWDADRFTSDEKVMFGVTCDMEIPESVLGPALLKTRRIFDENKASSYQPNLRSGRVNSKVLGRRAWTDDDRLFGKKRVPGKRDYAVLIGIDISSSNLGDNLALVKRSAFAQAELLSRAGVPFQIVAHSAAGMGRLGSGERGYVMHLHHIKDWSDPWDSETKQHVAELVAIGGNVDGHALEYMRKQLGRVEATDKILLYYTDGKMPAANKEEELVVLQRQIKLCKRDRITLLGVGIRTDSPVRHGLDTVQVDDDEDLKMVVNHLGKRLLKTSS